jgi:hypothetical protein
LPVIGSVYRIIKNLRSAYLTTLTLISFSDMVGAYLADSVC